MFVKIMIRIQATFVLPSLDSFVAQSTSIQSQKRNPNNRLRTPNRPNSLASMVSATRAPETPALPGVVYRTLTGSHRRHRVLGPRQRDPRVSALNPR